MKRGGTRTVPDSPEVRVTLTYRGKEMYGTVMPHQHFPWTQTVPVRLDWTGVWTMELPSDLTVIDGSDPDWALPPQRRQSGS